MTLVQITAEIALEINVDLISVKHVLEHCSFFKAIFKVLMLIMVFEFQGVFTVCCRL